MALATAIRIVDDPVIVSVLAREQTRPNRRAEGRRAEGVAEPHALMSNPVDTGCSHKGVARARDLIPPQIVNEDDQDVRLLLLCCCCCRKGRSHVTGSRRLQKRPSFHMFHSLFSGVSDPSNTCGAGTDSHL
jgi:hypothetical protein